MNIWAFILLGVNFVFMAGIILIVLFRRGAAAPKSGLYTEAEKVLSEVRDELGEVRRAATRIDAAGVGLERFGKGLDQRQADLEQMLRGLQPVAAKGSYIFSEKGDEDIYEKAHKMYRSGVPAGDVAKSLGLLSGEADVLSSLRRL